jgi:release factor glutamine methyltransferase
MEVTPDVLIPRVDTEVLVKTAVDSLMGRKMDARVLDLCCGSGCVGCAIAHEMPGTRIVMIDISPQALRVARRNVMLNNLNPRVSCIEADVMQNPPMMIGSFDIVVCNPPYIPSDKLITLDSSVRDHEPVWALDGGEDGLDFYKAILKNWKSIIRDGGMILFEVGIDQAENVKQLMRLSGMKNIVGVSDTGGIERVVAGRV